MANFRFFAYLFVLMIVVNCAIARARNWNDFSHHERRFLGCAGFGKSCSGFFSKSCCTGYKCHANTGKCVDSKSSSSWLGDRNGK